MFDYVRNSFKPLGEQFNSLCHTKGLINCMETYWISPAGELFRIDERPAFRPVEISEEELDAIEDPIERLSALSAHEPTGLPGKVRPVYHLGGVTIYPAKWDGDWEDWPEAKLFFRYGVITEYATTTFRTTRTTQS